MQIVETLFAAAVLAVCIALLARMTLGPDRRARFDAGFGRWRARWGRHLDGIAGALRRPSARARAEREAAEAIRRARERAEAGDWDGNVYRPKSFKRRKRDLH